jgi:hypothetical protein
VARSTRAAESLEGARASRRVVEERPERMAESMRERAGSCLEGEGRVSGVSGLWGERGRRMTFRWRGADCRVQTPLPRPSIGA